MKIVSRLSKECWNLDFEFIKWVNKHFKRYLKEADKVIDLTFKEYKYLGKKYTQKELIIKLIDITDKLLISDYVWNDDYEMKEEMLDIFRLLYHDMWW